MKLQFGSDSMTGQQHQSTRHRSIFGRRPDIMQGVRSRQSVQSDDLLSFSRGRGGTIQSSPSSRNGGDGRRAFARVQPVSVATTLEFRSINGSGNNGTNSGAAGDQLIRLFDNAFADGISVPRGGEFFASTLPNPRTISNVISNQTAAAPNALKASDWLWQWGQFIDHDLDLNESSGEAPGEFTPIIAPGDPNFTFIPFIRVPAAPGTGVTTPRQTVNQITAFIDASSVYGSDEDRANFLRSFSKGQLKTSESDNGEQLLPTNPVGENAQPNADGGVLGDFQYVAGDIRANEQTGLIAVHTLFVREHNRLAADLYQRLEAGEAALTSAFNQFAASRSGAGSVLKDEFIYQAARKVVGAKIQRITYDEFLPLLIGENTLNAYDGYKADVSVYISTEFANAAYRLGHTLLSNQVRQLSTNGLTETALKDAFFVPEALQTDGVDAVLRGLTLQKAEEVDHLIVDGVRNFLFPAGTGGLDLAAINIARGRETGLPGYVEVYNQLFPNSPISNFADLPFREGLGGDDGLFAQVYESVNQIDLWLGGVAEQPDSHGGLLGPTFSYIIAEQFERLRDGDRFFYHNEIEEIRLFDPDFDSTTLSSILRDNTEDGFLVQDNAFIVTHNNTITGDASNNMLLAGDRNDLMQGKAGNDLLSGRKGHDLILGDAGDDALLGGLGDDTLLGGLGNDQVIGDVGKDALHGGEGNDNLRGGRGNDTMVGGLGNDFLSGDWGHDVLEGRSGSDTLTGGRHSDTFVFGNDLLNDGLSDTDTIIDFQKADTFDFTGYSGSIRVNRLGNSALEVDLNNGEDKIMVFGQQVAIDAAQAQLDSLG